MGRGKRGGGKRQGLSSVKILNLKITERKSSIHLNIRRLVSEKICDNLKCPPIVTVVYLMSKCSYKFPRGNGGINHVGTLRQQKGNCVNAKWGR